MFNSALNYVDVAFMNDSLQLELEMLTIDYTALVNHFLMYWLESVDIAW